MYSISHLQENEQFESLCEKHRIWVISYKSLHRQIPLFLIWYTDSDQNSTDRLLTDQSGNILAAESLPDLINTLQTQAAMAQSEQFTSWLADIKEVVWSVQTSYDMVTLAASIADKKLDMPTLECLTNWRNLFGDFLYQDQRNSYLEPYHEDPLLKKAWNHYYNYIFWPRFNDKGQTVKWHRPPLLINTRLLLKKVSAMIEAFDARIHLVGPTHPAM